MQGGAVGVEGVEGGVQVDVWLRAAACRCCGVEARELRSEVYAGATWRCCDG